MPHDMVLEGDLPRSGATILIADDHDGSRLLLATILSAEGHVILQAASGDEALQHLATQPVDLALLDILMPGKSGLEVCRALRSRRSTRLLPVVLVTGLQTTDDRIAGIEAGADDFLSKPFSREELRARVRSLLRMKQYTDELENAEAVLYSLALGIELKDPYTAGHCERLSHYSVALGERLGLPEAQCTALRRAGMVHDIGKLAVPEQILLKPGPLTPDERATMETHAAAGERICSPLQSFRLVLPIIRHHHERLDGSGYPDGLRGDDIPLTAQILSTVDIYDALTTDRPYRAALPPTEAFRILREGVDRGWWAAELVDTFETILAEQPYEPVARESP